MSKILACIGCGNMGSAILQGLAQKLPQAQWTLRGCNRSMEKLQPLQQAGIVTSTSIDATINNADLLIIAVKPAQLEDVLKEIAKNIKKDTIVCSIAAGISLEFMRRFLPGQCHLVRCMPTTTALAGRGIFAFCFENADFPQAAKDEITGLFGLLGYCMELPENRFTDFSALIGAGPAYIFEIMQGLAQAGITLGFTAPMARKMLVELVAGCAELAEVKQKSFMDLRDEVCSPAGLTIAGVNVLDRAGVTGILVESVLAARDRGREMEKN